MGASQYASSFGRLQSIAINFLSEEFLLNLLKANSVTEMVKQLESTWYGEEIKKVFGHLFLVTDNCCWNKSMLPFNSLGVQR